MPQRIIQAVVATVLVGLAGTAIAQPQDSTLQPPRPFRIELVDEETGRGVPLVELRTVHHLRYVTDSNGVVAFDEPGLLGQKVFFHVKSHGYEFPKDSFGYQGATLETTPGGSARLTVKRLNIARRLYRVTGAGIYRDSQLTGTTIPQVEPLLNGLVLGQDSVLTALFRGRIHWFWGDTNRPAYPLGNFHTSGATSLLPGAGGLDPTQGVALTYFVDPQGFSKEMCRMPGSGPTWITGLVVLQDRDGRERMFACYAKIRPPLEVYHRGLVEFDPDAGEFRHRADFPDDQAASCGEYPGGHTFLHHDQGKDYVYYCNPFPLVRVPADPDRLADPDAWETWTCLEEGTTREAGKLDRGPDGTLRYAWKRRTQAVSQQQQDELVKAGKARSEELLFQLKDVLTGQTVLAHGGTVTWNAYRRRWVLIAVQAFGTSFLGEVWYAEADTPLGPWVYARKIVTHDDYSFYNPRHHPFFDQEQGRILFFEGTYTSMFSGSKDPTPRYDYNQIMYQLDVADPRLALPVPIYEFETAGGPTRLAPAPRIPADGRRKRVAFFALDRPGVATLPVWEERDEAGQVFLRVGPAPARPADTKLPPLDPIFHILSPGIEPTPAETVELEELCPMVGSGRSLGVAGAAPPGFRAAGRSPGRGWRHPGPPGPL